MGRLLLRQHQQKSDQQHGGDKKAVRAEDQKAKNGRTHADQGGRVFFGAQPLIPENGDEQRRQRKVDALGVKRDQRADHGAQKRAADPVQMIEQRDQKIVAFALRLGHGQRVGTDQGIGLVGQSEDEIRLARTNVTVVVNSLFLTILSSSSSSV